MPGAPETEILPQHPVILIAEDQDNDVTMLRRAFQQLAFSGSLQVVPDGEQAIAYLASHGKFAARDEFPMPDLFLLDLKMPRMNGFEVLAWIHGQPTLARLRTVVLTTSDDQRDIDQAYQLGAASFLIKPVNFSEFKDTIEAATKYWLSMNKHAPLSRPEISASLRVLAAAIRARHHVRVFHVESVIVSVLGPLYSSWQHRVEVFNLIASPEARECFAWLGADRQPVIVLASTSITTPERAVSSFYQQNAT